MATLTTGKGLPYPDGTELVSKGDDAIGDLAKKLDPMVVATLPAGNAADPVTAYPTGVSLMYLTNTQASVGGWPLADFLLVVTTKVAGTSSTVQVVYYASSGGTKTPQAFQRSGNSTAWTAWTRFAGDSYRLMSAAASVNIPDAAYTLLGGWTTEGALGDVSVAANGFTVATAGIYTITGFAYFGGGTGANPYALLGLGPTGGNAPDSLYRQSGAFPGGVGGLQLSGTWDRPMAAGDTVGLWAYQNSGAVRPITNRRFTCRRVGSPAPAVVAEAA